VGKSVIGYPVLGTDADAVRYRGVHFALGIGDPRLRRAIVENLRPLGVQWATLVSPTVRVHPSNRLGVGVVIGRLTDLTVNCTIGNHVMLNIHAVLGHSVVVGDFSIVDPNVTINGEARIGSTCLVGANAFVRDVVVGDYSTIGAGSVVVKDVEADCVVAGVPAKVIRSGAPRHAVTKAMRTS
jgi:sugar O-acyltransferase (sialic acid O-acetyltransferase NeuD family)